MFKTPNTKLESYTKKASGASVSQGAKGPLLELWVIQCLPQRKKLQKG